MENNLINFLELKTNIKSGPHPGVLRTTLVYMVAFVFVLTLLNFSVITTTLAFMRNQFTDYDEVLETELLIAAYHHEEPTTIVPQNKPVLINNNQPIYSGTPSNALRDKNSIYIPKINIKAPIIIGSSTDSNKLLKDLERGVLVYPGSAMPGQGSTVIVGHSSSNSPWNKYSNVFSFLNLLQTGDLVYVNYADQHYVYEVNNKKTGSVFSLTNADITGDLILSSCWPVGTDRGRILISATLQKK